MAEEIKQPKSTDEGVTVKDAAEVITGIETVEQLDAYAGEEAANEDGRTGVKKAYQARLEELQDRPSPIEQVHEIVAGAVEFEAARKAGGKLTGTNAELLEVKKKLDRGEPGEDDLKQARQAIANKANELQAARGMQQPTKLEQDLRAVLELLDELAPEEQEKS